MYIEKHCIYIKNILTIIILLFVIQIYNIYNTKSAYGENFYISPSLGENFAYANNKIKIEVEGKKFSTTRINLFEEITIGYNRDLLSSFSISLSHNNFQIKVPEDYEILISDNKLDYISTIFSLNYDKYLDQKIFFRLINGGGISYFIDLNEDNKAFIAQTALSLNYNLNYEIDFFSKATIDAIFSNLSETKNSNYIFKDSPIIFNIKIALGFTIKI